MRLDAPHKKSRVDSQLRDGAVIQAAGFDRAGKREKINCFRLR